MVIFPNNTKMTILSPIKSLDRMFTISLQRTLSPLGLPKHIRRFAPFWVIQQITLKLFLIQ